MLGRPPPPLFFGIIVVAPFLARLVDFLTVGTSSNPFSIAAATNSQQGIAHLFGGEVRGGGGGGGRWLRDSSIMRLLLRIDMT